MICLTLGALLGSCRTLIAPFGGSGERSEPKGFYAFGGFWRQGPPKPVGEATPPVTAPLTARRAVEENGAAPPSVTHYVRASSPVGGAKGDFSTSFAALTSVEMIREGISGNRCEG